MPIYEYHCTKCNNEFELMEPVASAQEKSCPECGATAKRKISSAAFHLKGSGWYASDYKKSACETKSDSPACSSCAHAGDKA